MKNSQIEDIERLTYDKCWDEIVRPLLKRQLIYTLSNSAFYKEKYKVAGVDLRNGIHIENFSNLPFTEKIEILAEQEAYPPFGRLATKRDKNNLCRVHQTSGSTGRPVYIILTKNDIDATIEAGGRAFRCAGLTSDDTVIHCLNYSLWAGGVTDHLSLEATGATVIPYGVGNTKKLVETIKEIQPNAISCTPSYMSRLEVVLKEEFGMEPVDLGLEKAFFGGEGGLQDPAVREQIEDKWRLKAIDANYGMADVLSIFGSECEARQGLHFHGQGIIHMELIDPVTNKSLPIKDEQVGEMVLTNLRREAQPLIRYRTGDVIKIHSTKQCNCGRKSIRFLIIGRTDDMITVRGINVYPSAVANILAELNNWFSGEFEFVLDSSSPFERPLLRIELSRQIGFHDSTIESYIVKKCHEELNFTPQIELLEFGQFPRTEGKTKRVKRSYDSKE